MPQMTVAQAQVIDPVLTEIARGFKQADLVGEALFPSVGVSQRGGRVLSFGEEDFELYSTLRAPGTATKRIQIGYLSAPYALENHSLEGVVPVELQDAAMQVPGINLGTNAVRKVQRAIGLGTEKAQADLATNAALYAASNKNVALAGVTLWSAGATSDPTGNINAGREAIRAQIGMYPNTLLLSASTFTALQTHPAIIDRIKYTGRDSATAELLAALWQLDKVVVGKAVYKTAAGARVDVWGKTAVLAYTELASLDDMGAPSYGYTYRLRGYPIVEVPYMERNPKSWLYPVTDEVAPVIAGALAGYLISPTVA